MGLMNFDAGNSLRENVRSLFDYLSLAGRPPRGADVATRCSQPRDRQDRLGGSAQIHYQLALGVAAFVTLTN
jgi:hypothetical protein